MYFPYNVGALILYNDGFKTTFSKSHHCPCWIKSEGTWSPLSSRGNVEQVGSPETPNIIPRKNNRRLWRTDNYRSCPFLAELHHFSPPGPTPTETQSKFQVGGTSLIANPSPIKV